MSLPRRREEVANGDTGRMWNEQHGMALVVGDIPPNRMIILLQGDVYVLVGYASRSTKSSSPPPL